jgi:hypothetical protein
LHPSLDPESTPVKESMKVTIPMTKAGKKIEG